MSDEKKPRWSIEKTIEAIAKMIVVPDDPNALTEAGKVRSLEYQYRSLQWAWEDKPLREYKLVRRLRREIPDAARTTIEEALTYLELKEEEGVEARTTALAKALGAKKGQEDDSELRRLLRAFMGPCRDKMLFECHVWMMKQWLWQVLRSCIGETRSHEIMIIFYSEMQATGKSQLIERLVEPFKEVTRHERVHTLVNPFQTKLLGRCRVVILDEFVGPSRDEDVAHIKNLITAKTLMSRQPHSDEGCEVDNRLSAIGGSNLLPPHQLNDAGGSRRLYSIHCSETPIRRDTERCQLAEGIDMRKVYKAVCPWTPCLYTTIPEPVRDRIDHMQRKEWKPGDLMESWLEEWTTPEEGARVHATTMADSIRQFAARRGFALPQRVNKHSLRQAMDKLGVEMKTTDGHYYMLDRRLTRGEEMAEAPPRLRVVKTAKH